ncbi:MAG: methyltransferase family protein [Promethearchaeota archaeon]
MLKNEIINNKNINNMITKKNENIQLKSSWKDLIPSMFYWLIIILQFILVFLTYNYFHLDFLSWIGWGLLVFFILFGGLPRHAFRKYGEIEKGKSHVYTTKLVDKGIYAVIRHPYWLSWILFSLSLTLISQHWIMFFLGIPAWIVIYLETYLLDIRLIEKFGENYKLYKNEVPRLNLILGVIKYLKKKQK